MQIPPQKRNLKGSLLLLLAAVIWGSSFVAQSVGMDYVGPFTFNCVRCFIGAAVLLPLVFILDRSGLGKRPQTTADKRTTLTAGLICGGVMFVATNLQQYGIQFTTVGKAGFITTFYIVIVPVLGLFMKKKCPLSTWLAVALALAGLYLLCITENFSIGLGDLLMLLCAVGYAFHILAVDRWSPLVDGVRLSFLQFLVCGALTAVPMFIFEEPAVAPLFDAYIPLLYSGVMSCGVAYTLQILGQRDVPPAVASLIMSLEACVSVLAGWALLHERLSTRELFGCLLMFAAIILVQSMTGRLFSRKVSKEAGE